MASKLEAYLATLPSGLESFDRCRAKGQLIITSLALKPLRALDALPPPIAAYVRKPPLASQWVPEAHYVALSLAIADEHRLDRTSFPAFWRSVMHSLTDGMYSTLLGLVHPDTIVRGIATRWGHFHDGTLMSAERERDALCVSISAPNALFSELIFDGYEGVLRGLIDRSRKPEGVVSRGIVEVQGPRTIARYRLSGW